jgi:hypothetical protein
MVMEEIVTHATESFDLEGRVVLHNLPSLFDPLPEVDPQISKLEVRHANQRLILVGITNYSRATDIYFTSGLRKEYDRTVEFFRTGNYKVHVFANGKLNIEETDQI